jgi:FtsP/CotA-like multicopper oxidase with cupredoxin domain
MMQFRVASAPARDSSQVPGTLLPTASLAQDAAARTREMTLNEFKDVVQCPPNVVTRIHISFDGFPGRYLWHCHVQEHEANNMMRPYVILK